MVNKALDKLLNKIKQIENVSDSLIAGYVLKIS